MRFYTDNRLQVRFFSFLLCSGQGVSVSDADSYALIGHDQPQQNFLQEF
jgi:hypothetical protein